MTTVWGDDERFVKTYFGTFRNKQVYSTFDWGIRDKDGYYFILGRTDDVINVAGHRLGTREIEEAVNMHPNIAECAVVGVADSLKGQMPLAFAVAKDVAVLGTAAAICSGWSAWTARRRRTPRSRSRRAAPRRYRGARPRTGKTASRPAAPPCSTCRCCRCRVACRSW